MKNPEQYKETTPAEGTVVVPDKKLSTTKTSTDLKIERLEEQFAIQQKELAKLRREIGRLKGNIGDVITVLKNRG